MHILRNRRCMTYRTEVENRMRKITPDNIVDKILEKKENWNTISKLAKRIIKTKEQDVRTLDLLARVQNN